MSKLLNSFGNLIGVRPRFEAAVAEDDPATLEGDPIAGPFDAEAAEEGFVEDEDDAPYTDADWVDEYDDEDASWDAALAAASGRVSSRSAMVNVFYHLLARQVPYDVLERHVREAVIDVTRAPRGEVAYTNGWLAKAAEHLVRQLEMAEEFAAEE